MEVFLSTESKRWKLFDEDDLAAGAGFVAATFRPESGQDLVPVCPQHERLEGVGLAHERNVVAEVLALVIRSWVEVDRVRWVVPFLQKFEGCRDDWTRTVLTGR